MAAATRFEAETVPLDGRDNTVAAVVCQEDRGRNRNRRNTCDLPRGEPFLQRARLSNVR